MGQKSIIIHCDLPILSLLPRDIERFGQRVKKHFTSSSAKMPSQFKLPFIVAFHFYSALTIVKMIKMMIMMMKMNMVTTMNMVKMMKIMKIKMIMMKTKTLEMTMKMMMNIHTFHLLHKTIKTIINYKGGGKKKLDIVQSCPDSPPSPYKFGQQN